MLIKISFKPSELQLLIDALNTRASRLESMAHFYPRNSQRHSIRATAMRELAARLRMEPDGTDPVMDWSKAKSA